jgi:M3 family oligoendopeptidase
MPQALLRFSALEASAVSRDDLVRDFDSAHDRFITAKSASARRKALDEWEAVRRRAHTWFNHVTLRFQQDTLDKRARKERIAADELRPLVNEHEVRMKRTCLEGQHRAELERAFGRAVLRQWELDVSAFTPALAAGLIEERKLAGEYIELVGSARVPFRGRTWTHSELQRFRADAHRETRHAAEQALWTWFQHHSEELDELFDRLVHVRTKMARTLGFDDFVELGDRRMKRVGYGRDDVARFRDQVREHAVPLAREVRVAQARALGLDEVMAWDERVFSNAAQPVPGGDDGWVLDRAGEACKALSARLAGFYQTLRDSEFLDVESRDGKAFGGNCTWFSTAELPFVFANFSGSWGDVRVLTHELGHAFQVWSSREYPISEQTLTTHELAEVHSTSLELLFHPELERFFGDRAQDVRDIHLSSILSFLPYACAIDHFQQLVYERPDVEPGDRHRLWQEMERLYTPSRRHGDLAHASAGGMWQAQRHVYAYPFYYIDYALAQTCALQLWDRAQDDPRGAMKTYEKLCERGGKKSFVETMQSFDLVSPFESGCLERVVKRARKHLGLA